MRLSSHHYVNEHLSHQCTELHGLPSNNESLIYKALKIIVQTPENNCQIIFKKRFFLLLDLKWKTSELIFLALLNYASDLKVIRK